MMRKSMIIWLIVAASLVLVGGMLFCGAVAMLKWDFTKLSTNGYETNTHRIENAFRSISVQTTTADVVFVPSEDSACSVVCHERTGETHTVAVEDGTLVIKLVDTRKWYQHIGIHYEESKITVYLPRGEYGFLEIDFSTGDVEIPKELGFVSMNISGSTGDVMNRASAVEAIQIKTTTGNIGVENVSAKSLDLSVSTGKVTVSGAVCEENVRVVVSTGKAYLTDVACRSVTSEGDTGDLVLKNVIAAEKVSIERSTGDVTLERCDADELFIVTDTGDVDGTLLSEKIFFATSDTGKIETPKSTTGGRCEITTDTGDIRISVVEQSA